MKCETNAERRAAGRWHTDKPMQCVADTAAEGGGAPSAGQTEASCGGIGSATWLAEALACHGKFTDAVSEMGGVRFLSGGTNRRQVANLSPKYPKIGKDTGFDLGRFILESGGGVPSYFFSLQRTRPLRPPAFDAHGQNWPKYPQLSHI